MKPDPGPSACSPYRRPFPREPDVSLRRPPRPRRTWRGPGLFALSLAGSLLTHGAMMAASACAEPEAPAPAVTRQRPQGRSPDGDVLFVGMAPNLLSVWSPPPALEACFDEDTIQKTREQYRLVWPELVAFAAVKPESWSELVAVGDTDEARVIRSWSLAEQLRECEVAAQKAGWRGRNHVLLRLARRRDGTTLTSATPLDGAEIDERLRCCLLQAEEALLPSLRPGEVMRREVRLGEEPSELWSQSW